MGILAPLAPIGNRHDDMGDGEVAGEWPLTATLRPGDATLCGDWPAGGFLLAIDDFAGGLFATPAAIRHRKVGLYFPKRIRSTIHDFADLAVADPIAQADVHGIGLQPDGAEVA